MRRNKVSHPDPTQGVQPDDDELDFDDEVPIAEGEDSRPPAASLTSIRLTRRRTVQEPRLVQRLTLTPSAGHGDAVRHQTPGAGHGTPIEDAPIPAEPVADRYDAAANALAPESPTPEPPASAPPAVDPLAVDPLAAEPADPDPLAAPAAPEPAAPAVPAAPAAGHHGALRHPDTAQRPEPAQRAETAQRAEPAQRAEAPQRPSNIVDYWSRLRAGRAYPAPSDLDSELIVATWPNSILLRHQAGESGMRAAALYKPATGLDGASDRTMDFSPMVVEWMLALAEESVRSGQPMAEKELFERPGGDGPVRFAACALPLSMDQETVDHVLCYLRALG